MNTKEECRSYYGDMSQLSFVRRSFLMDGRARMVEALDFDNGSGLTFTVLPGRGMDIAWAKFKGTPLSFMSKAGVASPECYDARDMQWLWNFFGGMLTTCGLSNVGDPCEDVQGELGLMPHGLHGRINNTAACQVCSDAQWQAGGYQLRASGQLREGLLHGQNLSLTRTITTRLGENAILVEDTVENEGFSPQPLMLFYHINVGYPILSPTCRLYLPRGTSTVCSPSAAPCDPSACGQFAEPAVEAPQHVFLHTFPEKARNHVGVYNPAISLGLALEFDTSQLPFFSQWKRMSCGDYVLGLEPANCLAIGRSQMHERGIAILQPGEIRRFSWKLRVLEGDTALHAFKKACNIQAV